MLFAALVPTTIALPTAAATTPPGGAPRVLFRLADPRISEASGIAVGAASPGVFYLENDSGDANRFFALDRRFGATVAVITVAAARNVDWEDIAVAPDAAGTPSVWLADIGDNGAVRDEVRVYRVREPHVRPGGHDRAVHTRVAAVWRLRYPHGAVDAESLAVAPDGTAYLVTKAPGSAEVYRLPAHPDAGRVQVMRRVGSIGLLPTGTPNPFGLAGQLVATSATFARDGALFAVRTYADAYVWRVGSAGLGAAVRRSPTRIPLPRQPQGEGIGFVGRRLVIDSEGRGSAVYAVPLPRSLAAPRSARSASAAPSSSALAAPSASASATGQRHGGLRRYVLLVAAGAALLVVVVAGVRQARRRGKLG